MMVHVRFVLTFLLIVVWLVSGVSAQVVVRGQKVYTMAGHTIEDGVVILRDGKIIAIGPACEVNVPNGYELLEAQVVTPGLIDAHCTVGVSGIVNYDDDQDQLEGSQPIQPELRATDAYNAHEPLIEWIRSFGVTTIHTGHAPGELVSVIADTMASVSGILTVNVDPLPDCERNST